jgi:putative transposase
LQQQVAMAQPRRLPGISYHGFAAYFVTSVTLGRAKAFSDLDFGQLAERELIAAAAREQFAVSAYCLMPDHVHLLLHATGEQSDLRRLVSSWKQRTGYAWSCRQPGRLWQHGYWERVLRDEEDLVSIARYVIENPVRAGLVKAPADYKLLGSTEYTLKQIAAAAQMRYRWQR